MVAVWKGARGGWCVYDYGIEAPDLHFSAKYSFEYAVLLRRPFQTSAYAAGHSTTILFFLWGLKLLRMPTNDMEDHKDVVGVQIGLSFDSLKDWELRKSHEDVYFFTHE